MVSEISIANKAACLAKNKCMSEGCQIVPRRKPVNCALWLMIRRAQIEQQKSVVTVMPGDGVIGQFTKEASKGIW